MNQTETVQLKMQLKPKTVKAIVIGCQAARITKQAFFNDLVEQILINVNDWEPDKPDKSKEYTI